MYPFHLEQNGCQNGFEASFGEVQQATVGTNDWDEEMRKLLENLEARGVAAENESKVEVKDGLTGWSWENGMASETMLGLAV